MTPKGSPFPLPILDFSAIKDVTASSGAKLQGDYVKLHKAELSGDIM